MPVPFPELGRPSALIRVDELDVAMDDLVARMFLFIPARAKRTLVIFNHGHAHKLWPCNGAPTVRRFLEKRLPVLVVFMPLYGPNTAPFKPVAFFHRRLGRRESPFTSPIRYFIEPIVRAVNYAQEVMDWPRVHMIGVSGGGWTTTLAAAVDPRIVASISVAGSVPAYLRAPPCPATAATDFEQDHPPLYAIADNLDLYVLAAEGARRGHLQVVNQFDPCCNGGLGYQTYRDVVREVVAGLGTGGQYDAFLDPSTKQHTISPHALERAILPFMRRRAPAPAAPRP